MHLHWSYGNSSWLVMASVMVAFWALVIWVIASFARTSDRSSSDPSAPAPEEVLSGRFAAGEIDEQEYRSRLEALRSIKVDAE